MSDAGSVVPVFGKVGLEVRRNNLSQTFGALHLNSDLGANRFATVSSNQVRGTIGILCPIFIGYVDEDAILLFFEVCDRVLKEHFTWVVTLCNRTENGFRAEQREVCGQVRRISSREDQSVSCDNLCQQSLTY